MNINISHNGKNIPLQLESNIAYYRQMIWIGGKDEGVYNTVVVDGLDTYQCTIAYDKAEDCWTITNGQVRTECPRGLKSDRAKACSMCRGCCVCVKTACPVYSLRKGGLMTVVNGRRIGEEVVRLGEGDEVRFE